VWENFPGGESEIREEKCGDIMVVEIKKDQYGLKMTPSPLTLNFQLST
jgi:hypothetical protein